MSEEADAIAIDAPTREGAANSAIPPLITSVGHLLDQPYVILDEGGEIDITPPVRSPMSIFDAGKWY